MSLGKFSLPTAGFCLAGLIGFIYGPDLETMQIVNKAESTGKIFTSVDLENAHLAANYHDSLFEVLAQRIAERGQLYYTGKDLPVDPSRLIRVTAALLKVVLKSLDYLGGDTVETLTDPTGEAKVLLTKALDLDEAKKVVAGRIKTCIEKGKGSYGDWTVPQILHYRDPPSCGV